MSRLHAAKRWELFGGVVRESAHPNQPAPLFAAVDAALGKVVGHRLFTLMVTQGLPSSRGRSTRTARASGLDVRPRGLRGDAR